MRKIIWPVLAAVFLLSQLGACSDAPPPAQGLNDAENSPALPQTETKTEAQKRPNILLILADDLGYSDLGFMGSEINTPNLDRLAAAGKLLTRFHVSPTCSPTRAMLLSGNDHHRSGFGSMFGMLSSEQAGQPGYETYLNQRVVTIAMLLADAGYHTYMAGKWHLARRPAPDPARPADYSEEELALWRSTLPEQRGFERAFYIMQGGSGHFDNTGAVSSAPVSTMLYNGQPYTLPEDYYSSAFLTDQLIDYIEEGRADGRPFFVYAAYTAPHWPLHAPDDFIARYEGVYEAGYAAIAQQRLARMKALGILAADQERHPGAALWPAWDSLSDEQKRREARKMQVYAAMVEALDHHIGRLIDYLKQSGAYENTFILFFSDNGAEGNNPYDLANNAEWIPANFDNSLENMGRRGSYIAYGPGWAQVSSTPYRLYKGFVSEGGITTPALAVYPGKIPAGQLSKQFASVLDVAPTLLELAGIEHPGERYQGRPIFPLQGSSMLAHLSAPGQTDGSADDKTDEQAARIHPAEHVMGWELFGRRAIRKGDWKLVSQNPPWGTGDWELYNLALDPAEQHDQMQKQPTIAALLLTEWQRYVQDNGVIAPGKLQLRYTNGTDYYEQ